MDDQSPPSAREHLRSLSGLEVMARVRDGVLPHGAITETMGYRVVEVSHGQAVLEATPGEAHWNLFGAVHGGWYGTVLDTAMGAAVMTALAAGRWYTTLEYKVNILRPAPPGARLHVAGFLQHAGRSTGVARGEVRSPDGSRVYATGSTTCLIMDA